MPRAPKHCGSPGCEELTTGRTYCPTHEREHQRRMASRRGTTASRGYGARHQRDRARWRPKVTAGLVTCWRCGNVIEPDEDWDLGHDDFDRSITRGPEHANRCNRSTNGGRGPLPPPPRSPS